MEFKSFFLCCRDQLGRKRSLVRFWSCLVLIAAILVFNVTAAWSARYHVRVMGTRTSNSSTPNDWSPSNCYRTLDAALAQAANTDSILMFKESHFFSQQRGLHTFLFNQDLDGDYTSCRLLLVSNASLILNAPILAYEIRGISFIGIMPYSTLPVLQVDNSSQAIQEILIEDCLFIYNRGGADPFGGSCIQSHLSGFDLQLRLKRCQFRNNTSNGPGGAVFLADDFRIWVEQCDFVNNKSQVGTSFGGRGGAISIMSPFIPSRLVMQNCRVDSNRSWGPGGGLYVEDANLTLNECVVSGNLSAFGDVQPWSAGAGLFLRNMNTQSQVLQLEVIKCRFSANLGNLNVSDSAADGGGILARGFDLDRMVQVHIADSAFEDNFNAQGGGLYVGRYTNGLVERCRFYRNTAYLNGGASYKGGYAPENLGETVRFEYCEFIGNKAGYKLNGQQGSEQGTGGAFRTRLYPRAEFVNCSFSNNRCGGSQQLGDAIYHPEEPDSFTNDLQRCVLYNCVFWGTNGNDIQVRSDPLGFSLVSHCAFVDGEFVCQGVTPRLTVSLTEIPYVGLEDLCLYPGSPCVDRGIDLGIHSDIRGLSVPQGAAPDIGAYEGPCQDMTGIRTDPGEDPESNIALWANPNPFNPQTTIRFALDKTQRAKIEIYNMSGRLVAVLTDRVYAAGTHTVNWIGRDSSGKAAASGTYLVRMTKNNIVESKKVMLVR